MSDITVVLTKEDAHKKIAVTASLVTLAGNKDPHFSVTCLEWERQNGRWVETGGGANHRDILEAFPGLAPLVALHLSDADGTPLYAVENGWYWAGGYPEYHEGKPASPPNAGYLAHLLRIPEQDAVHLVEAVAGNPRAITKAEFVEILSEMAPRWRLEARQGIALLEQLQHSSELALGEPAIKEEPETPSFSM